MENKLLIVEDNVAEAIYAQLEAAKAGLRNFTAVSNLEEGLASLDQADLVVSDLFFPAGNLPTQQYSDRFMPFYSRFAEKRFPKIGEDNVVYRAVAGCAEAFGVKPAEYVENFMAKMSTPQSVLKAARDAVQGVSNSEKYQEFQKIQEDIKTGRKLPLGIVLTEQAKQRNLPAVIVTSTYHHSNEFEPIASIIPVTYVDQLVDNRKDWARGIKLLLEGRKW